MLVMNAAGLTDVGVRRTNNEDSFSIDVPLLVVADGMGGAAAGEVASSIAVRAIPKFLKDLPFTREDSITTTMKKAFNNADELIRKKTEANQELSGMGTTAVTLMQFNDRICIGNIGDSRAYMISNSGADLLNSTTADANAQTAILQAVDADKKPAEKNSSSIRRLTEDNSVVMQLVQSGVIEEKDIRTHPLRNRITKCLGSMNNQEADITWFNIKGGDVILLCSDGLWEMIQDELIYAIVSTSNDPANICKKLIDAANNAGGVDNITAIIAIFSEE